MLMSVCLWGTVHRNEPTQCNESIGNLQTSFSTGCSHQTFCTLVSNTQKIVIRVLFLLPPCHHLRVAYVLEIITGRCSINGHFEQLIFLHRDRIPRKLCRALRWFNKWLEVDVPS